MSTKVSQCQVWPLRFELDTVNTTAARGTLKRCQAVRFLKSNNLCKCCFPASIHILMESRICEGEHDGTVQKIRQAKHYERTYPFKWLAEELNPNQSELLILNLKCTMPQHAKMFYWDEVHCSCGREPWLGRELRFRYHLHLWPLSSIFFRISLNAVALLM